MATKTRDTKIKGVKEMQKRTQVKDLPKPERKLNQTQMKKVMGGGLGPCDRDRH